jgi:hypothetical protein
MKGKVQMTTLQPKTNPNNVPLPAGAEWADVWEDGHRVVFGPYHRIANRDGYVVATALQRLDGTIDTTRRRMAPHVMADGIDDEGRPLMSAEQSRQCAAAFLNASDLLDAWCAR